MDNFIHADKQTEDAGALTFAKYWYQYNWALIKFLEESGENDECSLSIECHEDVMIIDKDDPNSSKVDLYQVKERSGSSNFTAKSLAYKKPSSQSKSIISKLVTNLNKPHLKDRINRLALVSANPFNLDIHGEYKSCELSSFSWKQIKKSDSDILLQSLKDDLGLEEVPLFVEFIKGIEGYNEEVHSSIAFKKMCDYIEERLPHMAHKPQVVFELLRSQLVKIGTNTNTYSLWSDFKKNKTISANQLNSMITKRSVPISSDSFEDIWRAAKQEDCLKSMNFSDLINIKKEAKFYYNQRLVDVDFIFSDIAHIVSCSMTSLSFESYSECFCHVLSEINKNSCIREYFDGSEIKIKAAVIVELAECH